VKVSIVRGGGLAGVPLRTELDAEWLPPDAQAELRAGAHAVTDTAGAPPPRMPDETTYAIDVEDDDGRVRTAGYSELTLPEDVRRLIAFVDERPESRTKLVS
jgi:emfourin